MRKAPRLVPIAALLLLVLLGAAGSGALGTAPADPARRAEPWAARPGEDCPPPGGGVLALAWLAGAWEGESPALGGFAEEVWLAPRAGSMAGLFRLADAEGPRVYELLLLEEAGDELFLRFAHVSPGFHVWQDEPLEYRLAEGGEGRAVFESTAPEPIPAKPRRLVYERPAPGELRVQVEMGPTPQGHPQGAFVVALRRRE